MSLINSLLKRPSNLTAASRFQSLNGAIYIAAGAALVVWPRLVQVLLRDPLFAGHESGLFRAIGLTLVVIGWLYYFGGRTGAEQLVAAGVIDRLIFVPVVCLPLAFAGVFSHTFIAFTILDMGLAVRAWMLLRALALA